MQTALEQLAVEKEKVGRHNASLQAELAADEEELRKLRAAEESALPALADEELAARFGGDVTLTARGPPVTLSPDQARPVLSRPRATQEESPDVRWGCCAELTQTRVKRCLLLTQQQTSQLRSAPWPRTNGPRQIQAMPRGGAVKLVAAVCLRAILQLSELPLPLCVRQIQAMTREELADWWRLYVSKLAGLLESVEGAAGAQPAPDVMQQLQQLQREALFLHIRCSPVSRWL